MSSVKSQYKAFFEESTTFPLYNRFKRIIYGENDALVEQLWPFIEHELHRRQHVTMCDIGGGDGTRALAIMRRMQQKGITVELDFIEPSSEGCRILNEQNKGARIQNTTFENASTGTYDIVLSIHSIFTFTGDVTSKLLGRLKPNGTLFIQSNAPTSVLARIKHVIDTPYSDKRFEINDLLASFKQKGVTYEQHHLSFRFTPPKGAIDTFLPFLTLGRAEIVSPQARQEVAAILSQDSLIEDELLLIVRKN